MILGQPLATELTELSFALQLCALLHSNIGLPEELYGAMRATKNYGKLYAFQLQKW